MGLFDWFGKEQSKTTTQREAPRMAPEYDEARDARKKWWDTISTWGSQPGYGAIQPNWDDLWSNARGKVRQYFGGGPEGPGAVDRLRSDAARRGMGDNPATSRGIARLGMKEGQMLQDIAVEQAMKEALLSEEGRRTWLSSMQGLAGLKPQLWQPGGTTTQTSGGGEGWDILGSAAGMGTAYMMNRPQTPGGTPGGAATGTGGIYPGMTPEESKVSGALGSADKWYEDPSMYMGIFRGLMGDPTGWAQVGGSLYNSYEDDKF